MTTTKGRPRRLSEKEFDALPPTLRRKYFSSLERLRLAQDGTCSPVISSRSDRRPRCSVDQTHSRLALERKLSYLTQVSSRRFLRKSQSNKTHHSVSHIDPQWFSALPQKIQQRHFTREEKVLITGTRERDILDAADEAVYRRRPSTSPSSPFSDLTRQSSSHPSLQPSESDMDTDGMDESFYDSFRWLEEEDELDLTLRDYHNAVIETSGSATAPCPTKHSFRRTLSLSSLRRRRPSLSAKPPPSGQFKTAPFTSGAPTRPLSVLLTPISKHKKTASTIDPTAQYYQDPEARLKLRVYLASPQKFDEAIEFGFPSLGMPGPALNIPTPPTTLKHTDESARSFLDDAASLGPEDEGDKDEDASVADSDSPPTPQDTTFQPRRPSKQYRDSFDRPGLSRPHILHYPSENGPVAGNREMTLKMTLTRPDLRTHTQETHPQSQLQPQHHPQPQSQSEPRSDPYKPNPSTRQSVKDEDPLRLRQLPNSPERNTIWDTMPDEKSRMKKFWKKMTVAKARTGGS